MDNHPLFFIGPVPVYGDLALAPMDGVSDLPFRLLTQSLGTSFTVSEFVNPRDILTYHPDNKRRLEFREIERPFGYQLYDDDVDRFIRASIFLQKYSPDFIDINLGCSARTVTHRRAGAALLREPLKVAAIIAGIKKAIDLPITAKMRLGWDENTRNYLEIAKILIKEGVSMITVHGRTKVQSYSGSADWDAIAEIKQIATVPVVGNGDVLLAADIDRIKSHTKCDAVMVGRGALANPFIFSRKDIHEVSYPALVSRLSQFLSHSVEYYGEVKGIQKSRKIIKRIFLNYGAAKDYIDWIMRIDSLDTLLKAFSELVLRLDHSHPITE